MKKKKKSKKTAKKPPEPTINFLTVCELCKIRLVVRKESTAACYLCSSTKISVTPWV